MNFCERILRFLIIYVFSVPAMILGAPITIVFDFFTIYHPDLFRRRNNPAAHLKKVEDVQNQVREWNKSGRKKRMCTARPTWQTLSIRSLNKSKFTKINVDLEDIIEIDKKNMILRVEPGMKMGTLTHRLLSQGLTIPIIPEFESLTIGGCINGTGIETSSHKYGLFADACLEFELVISDGSIVTCSKEVNPDLYYAISWSHGTIGFLTAVKIKLLPAPRYVKLEYYPTKTLEAAEVLLQKPGHDFLEGIMFGLNKVVVMHGNMTDKAESSKINHINRWYKPWFYKHVESKLKNMASSVEYIPARDYYHRHQRAYFWEVAIACPIGNFFLIRYLFGWVYPLNFQLTKMYSPEYAWDLAYTKRHVLQDFMIPISKLSDVIQLAHKEVEVYPIWLCPCKFFKNPGLAHLPKDVDEMYIDVGIYGVSPKTGKFDPEKKIRDLEKFVTKLKGFQFLYADTYMTREEFKEMFDMEHYAKVRKQYKCEDAFPEVYDKISRNARK